MSERQVTDMSPEPRLVILTNDDLKMSRGKRCAQAVHAALMALGVHPGCPVIVLGASSKEIEACPVQIRDAGLTELEPGTLTAGVREAPDGISAAERVNSADHVLSVVPDGEGFYAAVCSCGGYRSKPYHSPTTGLRHGLSHAWAREVADA